MSDTGWLERGLMIAGQPVKIAVRRLTSDERGRVAAEIAWFAAGVLEGNGCAEWHGLLDRILTRDVAITLDEELFDHSDASWNQLICGAFEAFILANGLDASIRSRLLLHPSWA